MIRICVFLALLILFSFDISYLERSRLSEYDFFEDLPSLKPAKNVYPYELNTPLFSDYAWKSRFIYLPEGKKMEYKDTTSFEFPVGSVLIKNFFYPEDFRKPEGNKRIIETRLLLKEESGWTALPYIWNEEQTDAVLSVAGGISEVSWKHFNGKRKKINYVVPTINQCKGCHSVDGKMTPIGPKARHLNRQGIGKMLGKNQLQYLADRGLLKGLPEREIDRNAVWNDSSTGSIDKRARAWLEVNCAHCHDASGSASNTGLYLSVYEKSLTRLGINKPPVAAGRASQSLSFDIVPGKPHESILLARMITDEVGQRMPEIGRTIMDEEGVELIRDWIDSMDH